MRVYSASVEPNELLAEVRPEAGLGVPRERPELEHREEAAAAAHPLAPVEDRPAARDAGSRARSRRRPAAGAARRASRRARSSAAQLDVDPAARASRPPGGGSRRRACPRAEPPPPGMVELRARSTGIDPSGCREARRLRRPARDGGAPEAEPIRPRRLLVPRGAQELHSASRSRPGRKAHRGSSRPTSTRSGPLRRAAATRTTRRSPASTGSSSTTLREPARASPTRISSAYGYAPARGVLRRGRAAQLLAGRRAARASRSPPSASRSGRSRSGSGRSSSTARAAGSSRPRPGCGSTAARSGCSRSRSRSSPRSPRRRPRRSTGTLRDRRLDRAGRDRALAAPLRVRREPSRAPRRALGLRHADRSSSGWRRASSSSASSAPRGATAASSSSRSSTTR